MRNKSQKALKLILALSFYLPAFGNGAINQDYFQPMFQSEYQAMEIYVIHQKYFVNKEVRVSDFYDNSQLFKVDNELKIRNVVTYEDMVKLLPTNIAPTTSEANIANILMDNVVRIWVSSSAAQNLSIVQSVNNVEKAMKKDMFESKSDNGISHKVNMNFDVIQGATKLTYSGFFDGTVSYKTTTYEVNVTLSKKTNIGTWAYNHVENSGENRDIISIAYNF